MVTYEKVLEVFKEYLEEDTNCEVACTSRGYVVMFWDDRQERWYDIETAPTPEALRDVLLDHYSGYLIYKMTEKWKHDKPTEQDNLEIAEKCRALWERCQ